MNGTQALGRALDILFVLADADSTLTVSEIADKVSIPESSIYRFIQTLEQNGIVERKGKGQITLGLRILDLARSLSNQIDKQLLVIARPIMEELTEQTNETSVLFIRSGTNAVCIENVKSHQLIRFSIDNGRVVPLCQGATGKTILAYENASIVNQVVQSMDDQRISDHLVQELQQIKEDGFSFTKGEFDTDAFAISAPILDTYQRVVASLSVVGPIYRFTPTKLDAMIENTRLAALKISNKLGKPS
ncbi:IclR family transcriptional regulator [Paenibacillus hodogayensis]|uniref:IclR family transcriptional regulator n=1 Tax=Paenibacillus hodogayensis TaxID=279208 RepID=A0ABV5W272_9BACL